MLISRAKTDFTTSVEKSLTEIDPYWESYHGIIVTGSHAPQEVEEKLDMIRMAREQGIPFLGICMGFQLMLIEYARNVMGIKDANTQEIDPKAELVVKMPSLVVGMRSFTYNGTELGESFWHQYKFNHAYTQQFEQYGWEFAFMEDVAALAFLKGRRQFFMGTQFHPEYQSSVDKPHPLLINFLNICNAASPRV